MGCSEIIYRLDSYTYFTISYAILYTCTGFPEWVLFSAFYDLVHQHLRPHNKISKFSSVVMFLMKLWLNLLDKDIAYRFHVNQATVSRNFHDVLNVAAAKTSFLIQWPERDVLRKTMPVPFRRFFRNCCVIIDCTEVFIERPSDLLARAQVWSNYKHHTTLKFLIGITPQGTVSFVSKCAGGRMSDKEITETCGLLRHLLPGKIYTGRYKYNSNTYFVGDLVLADRGFTCNEKARMVLAEVKTPPFTKGVKQLEKQDVDWSRELSVVRIHVERVIGLLKRKYTILQSTLPISLISHRDSSAYSTIDKIVRVCCACINMCPPVVPQE